MSQQLINVGSLANDGTGDTLRNSQIKSNANFIKIALNVILFCNLECT